MKEFNEIKQKLMMPSITATILESLIKRKEKEQKWQRRLFICGITIIVVLLLIILYTFFETDGTGHTGSSALSFILGNNIMLLGILLVIVLFFLQKHFKKKYDKADKELNELREEIIDRSAEIWDTPEEWKKRFETFQFIKDQYDVDLFHK